MSDMNMEDLQILVDPFVTKTLEKENLKNTKIIVTGKSEKGEGYVGDIVFVTVTGLSESDEATELNLVLKIGKKNKMMREKLSIRDVYLREIFVYDEVFPKFQKFQHDHGAAEIFNCVPKCYKTIVTEDTEVVVFENLKKRGFELHNRQIPMNNAHIKLVLSKYAQFHGTSFAMRDLDKPAFEKLTANYDNIPKKILGNDQMKIFYKMGFDKMKGLLRDADEKLEKLFSEVFEQDLHEKMCDVINADVEEFVIIHGDCWNNNFMFKYKNGDLENPTDIAVLDWQLSSLHSPVVDLSYFLYIVSGEEQVAQFDEYLRFYHDKLSEYMIELGSDPEKMFPFSTLMSHWEKYSSYGITFLISSLEVMLCDKDEALSLDDFEDMLDDKEAMDWASKVKPKNQTGYKARALATVRHYCERFKNNRVLIN